MLVGLSKISEHLEVELLEKFFSGIVLHFKKYL